MVDAERLRVIQPAKDFAAGQPDWHQRTARRLELFAALRDVAEGKEPQFIISPIELYEHGKIIPRAEVIRQTMSLGKFLQAENVLLGRKQYYDFYLSLSKKIPGAIIAFEDTNAHTPRLYRVYPPILAPQRELISSLAQEVKYAAAPPMRTPDEARRYQEERLLRRRNSQGELVPITFEEALSEFLIKTKRLAERLQRGEDTYDIASIVQMLLLPHIQGLTGDFDNFHIFMQYALVAVRNELYNQYRLRQREKRAAIAASLEEKKLVSEAGDKPDYDFDSLPKDRAMALRLRAMGIPNRSIAQILGKTPESVNNLVLRAKDSINPSREKRKAALMAFDKDTAVSAYEVFRKALGHVPTIYDLQRAHQTGALPYSEMVYRYHFGYRKTKTMQENLERMLEELAHLRREEPKQVFP